MPIHTSLKRNFTAILGLLLIFAITSCDARTFTSDAYALGQETGRDWRELTAEIQEISSWATEETGEVVEIPEVEKKPACRAMWILVGWPQFGLENSAANRKDFIDGCLTTIGS